MSGHQTKVLVAIADQIPRGSPGMVFIGDIAQRAKLTEGQVRVAARFLTGMQFITRHSVDDQPGSVAIERRYYSPRLLPQGGQDPDPGDAPVTGITDRGWAELDRMGCVFD